jgi:molecular chaperone HtpG/TNF receptor-associated protein 1
MSSPFMEPFKGTDIPVLILTNNIDEFCFNQLGTYKNKKLVNVESSYDEISKDVGKKEGEAEISSRIPEDDVTSFCLWLKQELEPSISKVSLSKRLKDQPAVVVG